MKKIIIAALAVLFSFTSISGVAAGGKCPFGGSPNWQGVCDTTTDSGQSYFGPTLTQEQADEIGPPPPPAPPPPPPSTPTIIPNIQDQTGALLTLINELLSQNNTLINALTGGSSPAPSPSPTTDPSSSETSTSTNEFSSVESSSEEPVSPSPSPAQTEESSTSTEVSERSISVKPMVVNNSLVINKKIKENIFNNRVLIVATKGVSKKTWTQKINKNVVKIKIPKRYLSWKITIKYIAG